MKGRFQSIAIIVALGLLWASGALANTFSPSTVSGLLVWLRADALTNAPESVITNWPDMSGNGFDATNFNPTAAPILNTNRINGHPALTGDGVSTILATTKTMTLGSNFTIFMVANKRSTNQAISLSIGQIGGAPTLYMFRDTTYNVDWLTTFWQGDLCSAFDTTKPVVESFVSSGSNQIQYINGAGCFVGRPASFNVNGTLVLFSMPFGQVYYDGDISEVLIYSNTLSAADHTLVVQYLLQKYLPGQHISFIGDSLTFGQNADYQQSYPCQTINLLGGFENVLQAEDMGAGGASIYAGISNFQLETASVNRTGHDVVVIWYGANDSVSTSPNSYYQSLFSACQFVRQRGAKVVVLDILPRGVNGGGPNENFRGVANALIRETWPQFADAFADVAADPTIGVTNALTNALLFNTDQTHLTDLGYSYVATNVYKALLTLPPLLSQSSTSQNVLSWAGPFTLQSATEPTGNYTNVIGATSPYTNADFSHPHHFFRLNSQP